MGFVMKLKKFIQDRMDFVKIKGLFLNIRSLENVGFRKERLKKLKNKDLIVLSQQFYNMVLSGCDIFTILDTIIYSSNMRISTSCRLVRKNIEDGFSMSKAFMNTNLFPKFFVNMVYAGEVSGNIDRCFRDLSEYYSREHSVRSKIINASIYPIILTIVSFIAINTIFIFVIPNFQNSFLNDEIKLSLITKVIFSISRFIRSCGIFIYLIFIFIVLLVTYIVKKDRDKKIIIEEYLFKIPLFRNIKRIVISEKFSRVLSSLIISGINIDEAISISIGVLDDPFVENKLSTSLKYIETGQGISYSLKKREYFQKYLFQWLMQARYQVIFLRV